MADEVNESVRKIIREAEKSGHSEARAIAECIQDALEDVEPTDEKSTAIGMVDEFLGWAQTLKEQLGEADEFVPRTVVDRVRRLTREEVIGILEGALSIQCYDHESTELLHDALIENIKDGTYEASSLPEE